MVAPKFGGRRGRGAVVATRPDESQFAGDRPRLGHEAPGVWGRELIEGCQVHSLVLDVVEDASPYIV